MTQEAALDPASGSKVSDAAETDLEPPRLHAAINAVKEGVECQTEQGPVTKFGDHVKIEIDWYEEFGDQDVSKLEGIDWGKWAHDAISYVMKMLRCPDTYDKLWETQQSAAIKWGCEDPKSDANENWTRAFSEVFMGVTYGGSGQQYFISGKWDPYVFSRCQPKTRKVMPAVYADQRLGRQCVWDKHCPDDLPGDAGGHNGQGEAYGKLWDARQASLGEFETNDDPAVPIVIACQHSASLVSVTRGFWVEDALSYAGYGTNTNNKMRTVFSGEKFHPDIDDMPRGTFYTEGVDMPPGAKGAGVAISDPSQVKFLTRVSFGKNKDDYVQNPLIKPGTIFVMNPNGFLKGKLDLFLCDVEKDCFYHEIRKEIRAVLLRDMDATAPYTDPSRPPPDAGKIQMLKAKRQRELEAARAAMQVNTGWSHEKLMAEKAIYRNNEQQIQELETRFNNRDYCENRKPVPCNLAGFQDNGAHIASVLRVAPPGSAAQGYMQLFDTSIGQTIGRLTQKRKDLVLRCVGKGIVDGCAVTDYPQFKGEPTPMVGVGVLPDADDATLNKMAETLRKSRPVGLCRFALTFRSLKKRDDWAISAHTVQDASVLYISRLMRMYDDSGNNFHISKLLWSLRCTPHFARLQPWWLLYLPRSSFAKSMWARGARDMTPMKFQREVLAQRRCEPGKHDRWRFYNVKSKNPHDYIKFEGAYDLTHVLTSAGVENSAEAGHAFFWNRYASVLSGGSTRWKQTGPLKLPPGLRKTMRFLRPDQEFHHDTALTGSPIPEADGELDHFRTG